MKSGKRPAKAVRRIVAILQRHINHPAFRRGKLFAGKSQPAAADIFSQCTAAQNTEYILEMIWRVIGLAGDIRIADVLRQIILQVVDCLLQIVYPVHFLISLPYVPIISENCVFFLTFNAMECRIHAITGDLRLGRIFTEAYYFQ